MEKVLDRAVQVMNKAVAEEDHVLLRRSFHRLAELGLEGHPRILEWIEGSSIKVIVDAGVILTIHPEGYESPIFIDGAGIHVGDFTLEISSLPLLRDPEVCSWLMEIERVFDGQEPREPEKQELELELEQEPELEVPKSVMQTKEDVWKATTHMRKAYHVWRKQAKERARAAQRSLFVDN